MKTSMNQAFASRQEIGLRLLDWSGGAVGRTRNLKRGKALELRIVRAEEGLFKYATAAKAMNGFWETTVYAALAVSAAGALAIAFFGS